MRIAYLQIISTLSESEEGALREALSQEFPDFSFRPVQGASATPGCVFLTLTGERDQDDPDLVVHMANFLWNLLQGKEIARMKVCHDRHPHEAEFRIAA